MAYLKRVALRRNLIFCFVLSCFLVVTNRWLTWDESMSLFHADDLLSYLPIANAAPSLPVSPLSHHHAQRFLIHYFVGSMSAWTGVSLPVVYRLVWALLTLSLAFLLGHTFTRASRGRTPLFEMSWALLFMNPYFVRYYMAVPGLLQDVVFLLGTAIVLWALFERRVVALFCGLVLTGLGRQTVVMLLPGLAVWMLFAPAWRKAAMSARLARFAVALAAIVGTYFATDLLSASFSKHSVNLEHVTGIFSWLRSSEVSALTLAEHFLRVVIPYVPLAALLVGLGSRIRPRRTLVCPELVSCFMFCAAIAVQPFLAGPDITGKNASRLSAMGLVFAAAAVLIVFAKVTPASDERARKPWSLLVVLCAVFGSFHHLYSVVGPSTAGQFAVLQGLLALILVFLGRIIDKSRTPIDSA